jgi:hypothetical protein
MRAYVQEKRSGSSFVGGYSLDIHAYFDFSRLIIIDREILRWRGFGAQVLARFPIEYIFEPTENVSLSCRYTRDRSDIKANFLL